MMKKVKQHHSNNNNKKCDDDYQACRSSAGKSAQLLNGVVNATETRKYL